MCGEMKVVKRSPKMSLRDKAKSLSFGLATGLIFVFIVISAFKYVDYRVDQKVKFLREYDFIQYMAGKKPTKFGEWE